MGAAVNAGGRFAAAPALTEEAGRAISCPVVSGADPEGQGAGTGG
jgi:hypothetical protein